MGRSIATPSGSFKNVYIDWQEEMGVYMPETSYDESQWAWEDFLRMVNRCLNNFSSTLEEPHDDTWIEDEVRLHASHGLARVTVSEYCGLASVSLLPIKRVHRDSWGAVVNPEYPLSEAYCAQRTEDFEEVFSERFDVYRGGTYASNGTRMFHKV